MRLLQALTYPECRTAALHLPAHPSPFPAIGKGGGGKGQIRPWLPWERICAQYGRCFASFVSSTASDRKGFVKGESVPLDRVLPTFARTKVGPRRVGVQMNTFCKTPQRRRRPQTIPIGQAYSLCLCKRLRAAEGDYNLDPKILLLTFHPGKAAPPRADQIFPRYSPACRRI